MALPSVMTAADIVAAGGALAGPIPANSIDRSVTAVAGSQLLAGTDPARIALVVSNPSDTAMAISLRPIASSGAAGAVPLPAGGSVTINPAPGTDVFLYGTAGKAVTVQDIVAAPGVGKTSPRTLGSSSRLGMTYNAATASASGVTYRIEQWARADGAIYDLQLVYPAWWYNSSETAFGGDLFLTASVEYPAGVFTQVRFGGAVKGTLVAGSNLSTDTVKVRIPAGAQFWVRTWVGAVTGTPGYATSRFLNSDKRDGVAFGGDGTVNSSTAFTLTVDVYGPIAITATTTATNPRSVAMFVDSIGTGTGDIGLSDTRGNAGWPAKLLDTVYAGKLPYFKIGRPGATVSGIVGSSAATLDSSTARLADLLKRVNFTNILAQAGINDIAAGNSAASVIEGIGRIRTLSGAVPTTISTLTPYTSGTWTTVGGQVLPTFNAAMLTYNNTNRSFASSGVNIIDASDAASSARDSGYWAANSPGLTDDGLHPNTTGVTRIVNDPIAQAAAANLIIIGS